MKYPKITVTREFSFEAAHSLKNYTGKCSNIHGHSYKCAISVEGLLRHKLGNTPGMLLDFNHLKVIANKIKDKLDHNNLNNVCNFNTTAENLAVEIYKVSTRLLKEMIKDHEYWGLKVSNVRLWETEHSYVDYNGEEIEVNE